MNIRETIINERRYQMMVPPVRQSMPLCTQVAALIGPVLGTLGEVANDKGWGKFSESIKNVDPIKADKLMMDAVKIGHLSFDSKPINDDLNFERHFAQYRGDVYPVCLWTLWECVRDFFPELGGLLRRVQEMAGIQLKSRTDGKKPTG